MYTYNQKQKNHSGAFWKAVAGILMLLLVLMSFIAIKCSEPSLGRVYNEFKYVELYEDGSFTAITWNNSRVDGCIAGALCSK